MTDNNLPVQLTSFIGREKEIEELESALSTTRMLTLTGAGGCGKTRLAIEVAAQLVDGYTGGVWLVDLATVRDPDLVPGAFASALGLQDQKGVDPIQLVIERMGSETALIIIDNCEHLIAACAEVTESLLKGCAGVSLLATSREPLGLPAETTWRVPSLSSPDETSPLEVDALTGYEAVRLFVDRALKTRPNFRITADNASAVAEICSRLDGIPLAIELAAARVKMLTPHEISWGLNDRFHLLTGGSHVVMPRQQTLQASVDWSYQVLTKTEKVVIDSLSVFAGGFTLDAAEAVCVDDEVRTTDVLDVLERLVDKSLVLADVDDGPSARYRLLETIRQFAMERLVERDRVKEVRTRHMEYYRALGAPALEDPEHLEASVSAELRREVDNFRAAMRWALAREGAETIVRLATQLGWLLLSLGQRREVNDLLDGVLDPTPSASDVALSRIWCLRGWVAVWYFRGYTPLHCGEQALRFAEMAVDERACQRARALVAQGAFAERDTAKLESVAAEMQKHAPAASFEQIFAICIKAANMMSAGDLESAHHGFEEAVALARSSDNLMMLTTAQLHLGYVFLFEGDFDAARALAVEASETNRLLDIKDSRPFDLSGLIDLYRGEHAKAKDHFEEGISTSRAAQLPGFEAMGTGYLALAALAEGDRQTASELASVLESFADTAEIDQGAQVDPAFFGTLHPVLCLHPGSRQTLKRIRETSPRPSDDLVVAIAGYEEAKNCRDDGTVEQADTLAFDALQMFRRFGTKPLIVDSLELAAGLAADQESFPEAARLFAAVEAARTGLSYVRFLIDQPRYDADLARIKEALVDEFPVVWDEGAGMTLDAAVGYALRGRGERKRPSQGWAALTPAELKVSALVAEGLSNPSIAERLFISRHTVETHLKNIYVKLGISSRTQLAGEAVRRNLTTEGSATGASKQSDM